MLTTTRVSVGIEFGPAGNSRLALALGLGLGSALAVACVAEGDGAGEAELEVVLELLFGSTVHETKNTDKIKISRDRFILLTPFECRWSNRRSSKLIRVFLLAWTISGQ